MAKRTTKKPAKAEPQTSAEDTTPRIVTGYIEPMQVDPNKLAAALGHIGSDDSMVEVAAKEEAEWDAELERLLAERMDNVSVSIIDEPRSAGPDDKTVIIEISSMRLTLRHATIPLASMSESKAIERIGKMFRSKWRQEEDLLEEVIQRKIDNQNIVGEIHASKEKTSD